MGVDLNANVFMLLAELQSEAQQIGRYRQSAAMQQMGFMQDEYDASMGSWENASNELSDIPAMEGAGVGINTAGAILQLALGGILLAIGTLVGVKLATASTGVGALIAACIIGIIMQLIIVYMLLAIILMSLSKDKGTQDMLGGDNFMNSLFVGEMGIYKDKVKDRTEDRTDKSNEMTKYQTRANEIQQKIQAMMQTDFSSIQDTLNTLTNLFNQMLNWFGEQSKTR